MSTAAKLVASLVLAAALAAGAVLALASPAAADHDRPAERPAYGEPVALDRDDNVKVAASVLAGVVGAGLIGYSLWPAPRAERAPVRERD